MESVFCSLRAESAGSRSCVRPDAARADALDTVGQVDDRAAETTRNVYGSRRP